MKKLLLINSLLLCFSCATQNKTLIAHRGLPRLLPEHTLEGVKEAMKYDIAYVEPDIVLTKDLIPVILHDTHLDTTTNVVKLFPKRKRSDGRYYAIDFTLAEIKTLTANQRINLKTKKSAFKTRPLIKNGQHKVPTLVEFIETVISENQKNKTKVGIYPEFKNPEFHQKENAPISKISHDILLKYEGKLDIIIQCFHSAPLKWLKSINSPFKRVQLIADDSWGESTLNYSAMLTEKGLKEIATYADGIGPWIPMLVNKDLTPNQMTSWAHANKLVVHPYTLRNDSLFPGVKTESQLLDLLFNKIGVDGVFSDNVNTTSILIKKVLK